MLISQFPSLATVAPKSGDAGLVQRLDYMTSGAILGAKTPESWATLFRCLKNGEVHKSYHLLVHGRPEDSFSVDSLIGSAYRRSKRVTVYPTNAGQKIRALPAHSTFERLASYEGDACSLLSCHASPARRHQVRAHAAHAGHALVGDSLYGSSISLNQMVHPKESSTPDFFLHARTLQFSHPISGDTISIEAPYPSWFSDWQG